MKRFLLDANVALRFLLQDDPAKAQHVSVLMTKAATGDCLLHLPTVVVAECVWVLTSFYRLPRADVAEALLALLGRPAVETDDEAVLRQSLHLYKTFNEDFVDCYLAAVAGATGDVITSFDRGFRRFEDVQWWEPGTPIPD